MWKKTYILLVIAVLWTGLAGLNRPDRQDLPMKKIHKAITKVWKVEAFEVVDHPLNNERDCYDNGCWLKVIVEGRELGMVYVGRVNSCRSGGCAIDPLNEEALSFEFFDYFMLAELTGEVRWVKVFNYEATQGHEVMSRGWLNQFRGVMPGNNLVFGQDIESISGATVSASAITNDIQEILGCVASR